MQFAGADRRGSPSRKIPDAVRRQAGLQALESEHLHGLRGRRRYLSLYGWCTNSSHSRAYLITNSVMTTSCTRFLPKTAYNTIWPSARTVHSQDCACRYHPTFRLKECRWLWPRGTPWVYSQLQSRPDSPRGQQQFRFLAQRTRVSSSWYASPFAS